MLPAMIDLDFAQDAAAHAVVLHPLDHVDVLADEHGDGDELHHLQGLVLLHPLLDLPLFL